MTEYRPVVNLRRYRGRRCCAAPGEAVAASEFAERVAAGGGDEARTGQQIGARLFLRGHSHAPLGHVDQTAIPQIQQVNHEGVEARAPALPAAGAKDPLARLDALENLSVPLIHGHKITVGRMGRDQPGGT